MQRVAAARRRACSGPRLVADTGEWGTYAWSRVVLGVPGMRVAGGTDEIMRNIVGERVLGLPKDPRQRVAVRRCRGGGTVAFVQPFERLRYLARWSGEDRSALVSEAADCLADFADDIRPGSSSSCRRLLAHHPACGPLWWLCARGL